VIPLPDKTAMPAEYKATLCLNVLEAIPSFLSTTDKQSLAPDSGTMWDRAMDLYNKAVKALIAEIAGL